MKNLILVCLFLLVTKANAVNSARGCVQSFGWADVKAQASDKAWDKLLEDRINHEVSKCYNGEKGKCLADFLVKLTKCESIGGEKFRQYVAEIRRSAVVHADKGVAAPTNAAEATAK